MTKSAANPQKTIPATAWALMALLAFLWGGSFPATRAALGEVGVLTTVAFRVTGGAIALWLVIFLRGLPVRGGWRIALVFAGMGFLNNILPWCLIVWGQSHIPSGLAAILNASTAIFTVLLAALVFADEKLAPRKAVGVLLGLAGVATVMGLAALSAFDLTSLAQLAILGASVSYAFAGIFARRHLGGQPPEVAAAGMLSASALVMIPTALTLEGTPTFDYQPHVWLALLYLGLIGSALAFLCYYRALRLAGAGNVSLVTLMIAPVSVVLGALFFGESLTVSDYAGFVLLAAGLLIIDGRILPRIHLARERKSA
ncbi:MAG: DMT family transporter [Rhodobacteraceae bacterium]|nr:DMT family transporter [Paracoccaceae bacterium]